MNKPEFQYLYKTCKCSELFSRPGENPLVGSSPSECYKSEVIQDRDQSAGGLDLWLRHWRPIRDSSPRTGAMKNNIWVTSAVRS